MRVSYNWLKQYVDFTYTPHELAEKLTMVGFEVEEVITTLPELKGLLVAEVKGIEKHPNADKLSVCTVYDGRENLQIICGAPNVAVGQKVAFAPIGVKLPAGFQINKAKIRGIESFGMICSEEELGLAEKSEGIWELNSDWQVGRDLYEILKEGQDYILDISITPNRPDAMSMIGIAREVAALAGVKYKKSETEFKEVSNSDNNPVEVIIENPDGCPRYTARIIKNLTLGPSPEWMVKRLKAAGIRPINNIVDITNYVLIETGQPLHAFDLENIAHTKIVVRDSKKEEKFITLDEKERILPEKTVMICDGEKPVAIGGIMGGLNSEISTKTTDILLESAYFAPERIGPSSKKLGLSSEASIRFERGVDPEGVIYASERAAQLFVQIAGGEVLNGFVDNYSLKISKKRIKVRINRVNDILGTDISKSDIIKIFQKLDIEFSEGVAIVPTFRPDLEREVDLIEEVARCFNFDNIPLREQTSVKYDSSIILHDTYLTFLGEQIREL